MLVATLVAPASHILWVHFTRWHVALVAAYDHLNAVCLDAKAAHFFLPVDKRSETVLVVYIVNHDNTICVFVEILADQTVVVVA